MTELFSDDEVATKKIQRKISNNKFMNIVAVQRRNLLAGTASDVTFEIEFFNGRGMKTAPERFTRAELREARAVMGVAIEEMFPEEPRDEVPT